MLCFLIELEEKRNRSAAVFPLTFPEEQQRAVLDESKSGLPIRDLFLTSAEKSQSLCYLREPESVSAFDTLLLSMESLREERTGILHVPAVVETADRGQKSRRQGCRCERVSPWRTDTAMRPEPPISTTIFKFEKQTRKF